MDKRDTQRNEAERRAEEERRDEQEYREEARPARPVSPEYQGEPLIFDELRDEPGPETPEERRVRGPFAAPVEEPATVTVWRDEKLRALGLAVVRIRNEEVSRTRLLGIVEATTPPPTGGGAGEGADRRSRP